MKIPFINDKGPSTEHCGTPALISSHVLKTVNSLRKILQVT